MGWQRKAVIIGLVLSIGGLFALAGEVTRKGPDEKLAAVIKRVEPLEAVFLSKFEVVRREIVQQRVVESFDARIIMPRPKAKVVSNSMDRLTDLQSLEDRFVQAYEVVWHQAVDLYGDNGLSEQGRQLKIEDLHHQVDRLNAEYDEELKVIAGRS